MGRFLRFEHVTFAYPGMPEQLLRDVFALFPEGTWTGVVGANGAGKTTLLKLAAGELTPSEGRVRTLGSARCVVQRTDAQPPDWDEFMNAWGPVAMDVRHRLGVSDDWYDRREALIHGERKRVQIAIALWRRPDVLALDEPTNHFDARTKQILFSALKGFHGAGLVGSHDRGFLDALCAQCLFVFPPSAVMRPGGVTAGEAEDRREQDHAKDEHAANSAKARRLKAVAQNRREAATTSVSQVSRPNALAADRTRRHG